MSPIEQDYPIISEQVTAFLNFHCLILAALTANLDLFYLNTHFNGLCKMHVFKLWEQVPSYWIHCTINLSSCRSSSY